MTTVQPTDITKFVNGEKLLNDTVVAITAKAVEGILRILPVVGENGYDFNAKNPAAGWQEGMLHWYPIVSGNAGNIKLGETPEPPIGERLDERHGGDHRAGEAPRASADPNAMAPKSPREAAMRYFDLPPLDLIPAWTQPINGKKPIDYTAELSYRIKLRLLREEGRTRDYTVVIEDDGIGQTADRMHETILSLGASEKSDKDYLIGVFGQGGSSAFDASTYSWLISRRAPELPASRRRRARLDDRQAHLPGGPAGRLLRLPGRPPRRTGARAARVGGRRH